MRSRVISAHLGVGFSSGMKIISLSPEELARRWQRLRFVCLSLLAEPLSPHTHILFLLTPVCSDFLEGLVALVFILITPFSDGCLGSNVDEGRSEVR